MGEQFTVLCTTNAYKSPDRQLYAALRMARKLSDLLPHYRWLNPLPHLLSLLLSLQNPQSAYSLNRFPYERNNPFFSHGAWYTNKCAGTNLFPNSKLFRSVSLFLAQSTLALRRSDHVHDRCLCQKTRCVIRLVERSTNKNRPALFIL